MIYQKFVIRKYKAIADVEINLKNRLIPIIGINESGKSSLLHSILAFDHYNDSFLNGSHLDAKNRYDYESIDHIITAYLEIDQEDLKAIKKELGFAKTNKTLLQIQKLLDNSEPLILSRNLDDKKYYFENIHCDDATVVKLVKEIFTRLPYILFFDDFNDRVPDKIIFEKGYFEENYNEFTDSNRTEWNSYIEEIFNRATNDDLRSFLQNKNKNDRDGILSDVNDILNEDIIQNWKKLKVLKNELANEKINDLKLSLDYIAENNQHIFIFKVIDKNFKGKGRFFSVTERSKGFQWFFNFAIKLKYNPKYVEEYDDAIYLLDEPGSYLHSSAQEELLKSLKEISETNKVIYCTHSQYLLNPDTINLSSIRIAIRDEGLIKFQSFGEYEETNKSQGSLSPVYHALHLNIAKHVFPRNENVLIVEGIIDYYILTMAKKYLNFLATKKLEIIPGAGVTNLKELISLSIAWSDKYSVLFDSDEEGTKAFNKYEKFFKEEESKKWIPLTTVKKKSKVEIEDIIAESDKNNLLLQTKTKNIKRGIAILFYQNDTEKTAFLNSLSKETLANINHLEAELILKFE